jgi:hypothetical protein
MTVITIRFLLWVSAGLWTMHICAPHLGINYGEVALQPNARSIFAEISRTEGMKRACSSVSSLSLSENSERTHHQPESLPASDQLIKPLFHLIRSLVRECYAAYVLGRDLVVQYEVGDA